MRRRALLIGLPVLALRPARGQTVVYRCGPDGRSYSQAPCPDGVAMILGADPDAQARREAQAVAAREARLAQRLVDERRAREAEGLRSPKVAARAPWRSAETRDGVRDQAITRGPQRGSSAEPPPRESRRARVPRTPVAAKATPPSGG